MKIIKKDEKSLLPEIVLIDAQSVPGTNEKREVEVHIYTPAAGINENTGLMLISHNWGGTWEMCWDWCRVVGEKFNLVCIDTNYYQSGWVEGDGAYDHSVLQACDCLRALYEVRKYLDDNNIIFNRRRYYAAGASGGGNMSQMVNKFAPQTFGCIIDLCGMSNLSDEVAFGLSPKLNAGYSRDEKSAAYLSAAMQEIRDLANLEHLAIQYKYNPANQVVIVHGMDDLHCPCADKIRVFGNMVKTGFRPEGYFINPGMIDGIVVCNTGHQIGDRAYVIAKFGQKYISERGEFVKVVEKDDFDRQSVIEYPVTGGVYTMDFSKGAPVITFTGK